ncbi:MAG: hypothetical protein K6B52_09545 [Clostridiales bacterium]|nr:hypothetical protein [Clostridiales bacterium]
MKEITDEEFKKIAVYTGEDYDREKLYTFSLILCDNDIDRDGEKFTSESLETLAKLFTGKSGVFDHDVSAKNQTARIYETEVVTDGERKTADGEKYTYILAKAYTVKTDGNDDLIEKIEAGINKETSVGCAVGKIECSICGEDVRSGVCPHEKGKTYDGKSCFYLLKEPTDAYEWSFVAVPAQKNAGVIKTYRPFESEDIGELSEYRQELKNDIVKSLYRLLGDFDGDIADAMCEKAGVKQLRALSRFFAEKAKQKNTVKSEIFPQITFEETNAEYII